MSSRRPPVEDQGSLFDLELDAPPGDFVASEVLAPEEVEEAPVLAPPVGSEAGPAERAGEPAAAPLASRLSAGLVDLAIHLAVLLATLGGLRLLGVVPGVDDLPALAIMLLVFSLFYSVIPLAFWGRTAGMAAVGVLCRGELGQPLTFGQAAWRWLAGVLTVATAGLPLLLALRGASLGDRLSGSVALLVPRR